MSEQAVNPLEGFTDEALIGAYRDYRDRVLAEMDEAFKKLAAPINDRMKRIQAEMHRRLLERKANHSTTDAGTAYLAESASVKCTDKSAYHSFCIANYDTWGKDLLTAHVQKETVELFITKTKSEQHPEGLIPPGLTVTHSIQCNIRK